MACAVCGADVPAAAYCGTCGAQLSADRGDGRGRLRIGAYAAAPGEHTLRLAVASSLFPHLPHRSRAPFRVALILLIVTLIICGLLRWQAPLVAVSVLGIPLLFALYLYESDVHHDLPIGSLALTAAAGVGLGAGWGWYTGNLVADNYDVAFGLAEPDDQSMMMAFAAPVGGAVLMLVPVVVMRWLRPHTRESLDGFAIGALSALAFTAAATLTRLAPQFATGVTADDRPADGLLVEAGIQGIAMPLTAAALGGLVGAALWFGRPKVVVASLVVTLSVYAALGLMDIAPQIQGMHFGVHALIAIFALVALRVGLQTTLLHERHDEPNPDGRVQCPHCEHVVADMPFCPNCGVAARAASRTSRTARRAGKPATETRPGYAVPANTYAAVPVRRTSHTRLLSSLGAGAAVAVAAGVTAAVLATPSSAPYVCPPDCGRPPYDEPIESTPRFVSEDGRFSVQYPGTGTAYDATLNSDGVELKFVGGDTGIMQLFGIPDAKRTPQEIANDLIDEQFPNATIDYEIPNAMVGYEPGYGVVVDEYPQDASATYMRLRLVLLVAVKDDYALVAAAIGPYHEFTREFGTGHPSGANLQLALDMGKYVNSFRWRD
jgi:hypothetical protein